MIIQFCYLSFYISGVDIFPELVTLFLEKFRKAAKPLICRQIPPSRIEEFNFALKYCGCFDIVISNTADCFQGKIRMHEGFDVPQSVAQSDAQNVAQTDALSGRTFTKMEESIIRAIKQNPHITRAQIAEQLGVSKKTIERRIKELSFIHYVGSSKSGHWEIQMDKNVDA